jgi:hypothetical protein
MRTEWDIYPIDWEGDSLERVPFELDADPTAAERMRASEA